MRAGEGIQSPLDSQPLDVQPLNDPPPPYPNRDRRARRNRRAPSAHVHQISSPESDQESQPLLSPHAIPFSEDGRANEATPLLAPSSLRRSTTRPRTLSMSSTIRSSISLAPSLSQTVVSLFRPFPDDSSDLGYDPDQSSGRGTTPDPEDDGLRLLAYVPELRRKKWSVLSRAAWQRYFRVLTMKAYWLPVFHLMVVNFPYALAAWIYLFVFTLTGTALLMALPLGALLCFFDLLGARIFARGELALQWKFHRLPGVSPPFPPRPIFTRLRAPTPAETEAGILSGHLYEHSFYKNSYAMFTDPTSYQALFYFLLIKPVITLLLSLLIIVVVPVSLVLVVPAPLVLRAVRRIGVWQAGVALEGLYFAVS